MHNTPGEASVNKRRVVDAFTRMLHALMALCFTLAYLSSEVDSLRLLHVTMGYTLGVAVLIRLVWGVVGPRRVHLGVLWRRWPTLARLQEDMRCRDWPGLLVHVLAISMVVVLGAAWPTLVSGYVTYFSLLGQWTEDIHETTANAMLLAVLCHVTSVLALTWLAPDKQIRPMLTGHVSGPGPHLVKHNLMALSFALLLMVVGFWAWQACQYAADPELSAPPQWLHPVGGYRKDDDD